MILKHNGILIASKVELAEDFPSKILGLMFRRNIPEDYALLFIFKEPRVVGVHMLFMRFSIDVIFLDNHKRIIATSTLRPWFGYKQIKNVRYFIEMNRNTVEKYGLKIGDTITVDTLSESEL